MIFKNILIKLMRFLPVRVICNLQSFRSRGSVSLGRGAYIHPSVHLLGMSGIAVGENSFISEGGWLNVNHRSQQAPAIIIGNNCFVGKRNFFSSGARIILGDYTLTTLDCKFLGSSHVIDDPILPYITTGTTDDCVIDIGVNCFFGVGAMVLGNVQVGHGSVVGAGAHVLHNVPPFSLVVGNPGRVIKRFSFSRHKWVPVEEITDMDVANMPVSSVYRSQISSRVPVVNMPLIALGRDLGNL